MPYKEARFFARSLGLQSSEQWINYCRGKIKGLPSRPKNLPIYVDQYYKSTGEWQSWMDFLGTDLRKGNWMNFDKARSFVRKLNLSKGKDWYRYCEGDFHTLPHKPDSIPTNPQAVTAYKPFWKGWVDWLGQGRRIGGWRDFYRARSYVRKLRLRTSRDWKQLVQSGALPNDIPKMPWKVYKDFWVSLSDWLGSSKAKTRVFRPFPEARKFAHSLKLNSSKEWQLYCAGKIKKHRPLPADIPVSPAMAKMYKKHWKGWGDFLGTRNKTPKRKHRYNRKLNLDYFKSLATKKGGKCLSLEREFTSGLQSILRFECKHNHNWRTTAYSVYQGRWCPDCGTMYRSLTERRIRAALEQLLGFPFPKARPRWLDGLELDGYNQDQRIAFEYQGKQHYTYINHFHKNKAVFKRRKYLDRKKRQLCRENGVLLLQIKCLKDGTEDLELISKMKAICEGNSLKTRDTNLLKTLQISSEQNLHFQRVKAILKGWGYKLKSKEYKGHYIKLEISCSENHNYFANPADIKRGRKCPKCRGRLTTLNDLKKKAVEWGLILKSTRYRGPSFLYEWKCKAYKQHPSFHCSYQARNRKNGISCPFVECGGKRYYLRWFQDKAKEKGGTCLSKSYRNIRQELKFRCSLGHDWVIAATDFVRFGKWCKACSKSNN